MTRNNRIAILLLAACAEWTAAVPACAQVTTSPVVKAAPARTAVAKAVRTRFEVLRMTSTAIQVRSLVNQREIHTFSYSNQIRARMQKLFNKGGYQYGDKITIQYKPGTEVALDIKGKSSKHL
jgi:hypothetical protein